MITKNHKIEEMNGEITYFDSGNVMIDIFSTKNFKMTTRISKDKTIKFHLITFTNDEGNEVHLTLYEKINMI